MTSCETTPLIGRLHAVALTWATRPIVWFATCIGLMAVVGVATCDTPIGMGNLSVLVATQAGAVAFGVAALIGDQARRQFVTPVARLTPGYAGPQLALVAVLGSLLLFFVPLWLGARLGTSAVGMAAFFGTLGALAAWAQHRAEAAWLAFLAFGSSFLPPLAAFWLDPELASAEPWRRVAWIVAAMAYAAWLLRVATLHEEREDYRLPTTTAVFARPNRGDLRSADQQAVRVLQRSGPLQAVSDRWFDAAVKRATRVSQLLGLATAVWPTPIRAAWALVMFGGVFGLFAYAFQDRAADSPAEPVGAMARGVLTQPVVFALFMPSIIVAQHLLSRGPRMAAELLRPATREAYVDGLIGVSLREAAWHAAALWAVAVGLTAWLTPEAITLSKLLLYTAMCVTGNLAAVATQVWLASYRLGFVGMFLGLLPAGPLAGLGTLWWLSDRSDAFVPWLAVTASGVVGAAMLQVARRRWLRVEFG